MNLATAMMMKVGTATPPGNSAEYQDLIDGLGQAAADIAMGYRYGTDDLPLPLTFAQYAALFSGVGDTFRDPTFGTPITVLQTNVDQINMERPHMNADNTYFFIKTGSNRWEIWDTDGVKVGGNRDLRYSGTNPTDGVRWHPLNPYILFYPIGDEIIYYDIRTDSQSVAATSPNGTLGTGNRRLAGGDGNHAVKVGTEGWMLLSHGGNNTECQVLVLGDPDNAQTNDYKIVSHNWNGSSWELQYETWTTGATKWDFPTGSGFDYATLTEEDPTDGWAYIMNATDGLGTRLYNLSGTEIDQIDSNSNHMNQVYATVSGTTYLATVKKTVAGMIPPAVNVGDAQCWYYTVDLSTSTMALDTFGGFVALDWDSGYNQAGGGQYGSYNSSGVAGAGKCLLAMNSAVEEGATDWQKYYSEIVELQLNRDAGDNTPRRLLHHYIDTFGTVGRQPEAWYSNNGNVGIFKTNVGGQLSGNGYLFFFNAFPRTPVAQR